MKNRSESQRLTTNRATLTTPKNEFTSREFSLYSDVEEISLRDTVCWRIENSKESLGSVKFEFAIDLVCSTSPTSIPLEGDSQSGFLSDAVHEQGSSEMVRAGGGGDGEILGSHSITFCNIGAETVMKGTKLLFRDRGLGALHGVSTCTLVDIRYDQPHRADQHPAALRRLPLRGRDRGAGRRA